MPQTGSCKWGWGGVGMNKTTDDSTVSWGGEKYKIADRSIIQREREVRTRSAPLQGREQCTRRSTSSGGGCGESNTSRPRAKPHPPRGGGKDTWGHGRCPPPFRPRTHLCVARWRRWQLRGAGAPYAAPPPPRPGFRGGSGGGGGGGGT
jgi:hypothetical protein